MKMKCIQKVAVITALLITSLTAQGTMSVDEYEREIQRVRRELVDIQNERVEVADQIVTDRGEFDQYRERALGKMETIRTETDSVRNESVVFQGQKDSLGGVLLYQKNRQQEFLLKQEQVRVILTNTVIATIYRAKEYSPSLREKPVSALQLLKVELEGETIDNIEGFKRLFTIVQELDNGGSSTQIIQGTSPIPEIRGTTYRFRMGTLFEAVVNAEGTRAAIWSNRDENGFDHWDMVDNITIAEQILQAVNVREGKALPTLVSLPFTAVSVISEDEVQ